MKIAMVGEFPLEGESVNGGVQAATLYLVEAMAAMPDIELHVVSFRPEITEEKVLRRGNVLVHLLGTRRMSATTNHFQEGRTLKRCLDRIQPDLVHGQGALMEGFLAVRSDYPSVVTFHGMIREDAKYKTQFRHRARHTLLSITCERYCARRAPHTILISPYVKKYFGNSLRGKTHHIANPVRASYFDLPRRERPGTVLFAGRVIPRKGCLELVDAIAQARKHVDLRLHVAGALNDRDYVSNVKALVQERQLEGSVEFLGLLDESQLAAEFAQCSVLALTSFQETAPMVIQQAMAAGIPIVATRVGGVEHLIDDGETGFVCEVGDTPAVAQRLTTLMLDRELRARMGLRARAKALRKFQAESVARETVDVYRKILGEETQYEAGWQRSPRIA